MTANELKYTYMEEAMSILDNEELMRKALSHYSSAASDVYKRQAFQSVKDLKAGKITSRPLEDLLNEL